MLRSAAVICLSALWTAVMVPLALASMLLRWNRGASVFWARRAWAGGMLRMAGARIEVEGKGHLDPRRPALYLCNHQSAVDIPLLLLALPVDLRFVAKKSLRYIPFLGWFMWIAGHVFVDRGNRRRALDSLERAAARIRGGVSVLMFPEGTRSADGTVLPFKKGPFALALRARVPICPVALEGTGRMMPKRSCRITPGSLRVKIGAPIEVESQSRNQLIDQVRRAIIELNLALGGRGDGRAAAADGEGTRRQET